MPAIRHLQKFKERDKLKGNKPTKQHLKQIKPAKLKKPISLLISLLLMIGMISFLRTTAVQAATVTYTFGKTEVGSQTNWFSTDRDASRFQLTQSGTLQSITTYFRSTGFNAKAAIYTDNNGAPSTLIAQSSGKSITTTGWNTFSLPQTSLTPGYYWLCVVCSSTAAYGAMTTTSTNTHAWKINTYSGDYPQNFGTPTAYGREVTSIYATYTISTGSTPTPTPTPTPTSTLKNLAPIPTAWALTYGTGPQITHLDTSVTYNGNPSIRIDRHTIADMNSARECNSGGYSIKPGDRVVFSCWMKTTASGYGDTNPYSGARIGIDLYASSTRIGALQSATYPDTDVGVRLNYVNWGTSQWTKRTIDFVVPQTIGGATPTGMILWLQVWSSTYGSTDPGQAWFANTELYINP